MSGRRETYVAPERDRHRVTVTVLAAVALATVACVAAVLLVREVLAVAP